ncbi:hypothetical protein EJB05_02558, partial [Eragrostis curvula]
MDQQSPLQEAMELHGADAMGIATNMMIRYLCNAMPNPPVSPAMPLASAVAAHTSADSVDQISGLPDEILKYVFSRLPASPSVFTDPAHTLRKRMTRDEFVSRAVIIDASSALAAHPGPFHCFYLTSVTWSRIASHEAEIARWLQLLATKGVEELVFINRQWPFDLPLPAALFRCTALTHLHLGLWKFPDTAVLPCTAGFPHLRELVLSVLMEDEDLAFMLNRSPVLEFLTIIASQSVLRLRLVSRSLRIGNAPNLHMLGYWQPDRAELGITNNIIQGERKHHRPKCPDLGFRGGIELHNEVQMVPCFLKYFPNVESLYVYSSNSEKATDKPNLKFWQEAGHIACVQSHLKKLVFQEFRGMKSELLILKFIAEKAQALEKMVITLASEYFSSRIDANVMLKSVKWASEDYKLIVLNSPVPDSGSPSWDFRVAADFSCDPFDHFTASAELYTKYGCH